jgi:superfamily II DNA or RNA helicase
MEPSSDVPDLPFRKKLRKGQRKTLGEIPGRRQVNVRQPTGYGKTFLAAIIYAVLKAVGRANRLLVIFPTDKQLDQFVKDGPSDLRDACVTGPLSVVDLRYYGTQALKKHKHDKAQVFVTTIQALAQNSGRVAEIVGELMRTGRWMVVVDEYHHYGVERTWGKAVLALHYEFLLCMSATPFRPGNDGAFGPPDVVVTYREALEELAVKPLWGHCYHYVVDVLQEGGDIRSYTTAELARAAEGDSPDQIERFIIQRKMRWSPKYISPLVYKPIERMIAERLRAPGGFLQVIVGALCVSHAKMVCQQIRVMFPELRVDWVGTGENGRSDEENKRVLNQFCPPKDERGQRHPTLDVLVHVGLAGEGLDSIHVSEVVHLNPASKCNSNDQENGRGARYLPDVVCHINYDASSGYRGYEGIEGMTRAMDDQAPDPDAEPPPDPDDDLGALPDLPDEPHIEIYDMRLDQIDSGDPDVKRYERVVVAQGVPGYTLDDVSDPNPDTPFHRACLDGYKTMRRLEAAEHDEQSTIEQWREAVKNATRTVTGVAIRILYKGKRVEDSVAGNLKWRINARKKAECGEVTADVEVCRRHYQWLVRLDKAMRATKEVPEWLR